MVVLLLSLVVSLAACSAPSAPPDAPAAPDARTYVGTLRHHPPPATKSLEAYHGIELSLETAKELMPWTLGYALSCWEGYSSAEGIDVRSFVSLAAITAGMAVLAMLRFRRMDVP